jgi:uncharacterized protein
MKRITLEEHFGLQSVPRGGSNSAVGGSMYDLGEGRLKDMDEAGIDMQVLQPGMWYQDESRFVEELDSPDGGALAKKINNELALAIKKYPKRFAGFASVCLADPKGAANELERAVKELGLKAAQICTNVRGEYLDDKKFWPF